MPIAQQFQYAKPKTLEGAVALLAEHGEGATVLAGGTDVVSMLRDDDLAPDIVVDIKGIGGLSNIKLAGDTLLLGPLVTFSDLVGSSVIRESFPLFYEMAAVVASRGIRNRGTVVGNICTAVPSCDSGPVLLVHDASVHLLGQAGERTVRIGDWFTGPRETALAPDELVIGLEMPAAAMNCGGSYVKLRRYHGEDLAQANVAVLMSPEYEYRVAFGAVAPTPVRARKLEAAIRGREPSDAFFAEARKLIARETSPIEDIRATAEYRAHMLNVMFERGVRAAAERLDGGGPDYGTEHI